MRSNREENYWLPNPVSFMLNKSMVGKTIAHYQILQKLGCGRMGVVYKAVDLILERFVTVKFLPFHLMIDEKAKKRFIHEAKSLSALDHPNICSIYNIYETPEGFLFIVMPFYDGKTLRLMIDEHRLTNDDVCRIGVQIGQGLFKAHEKGIVHRDVKPDNIIVTNDNIVKLIDFGLAKLKESTRITEIGTTMGTVAYMSPEQTRGIQVDTRTDIWSLGVVIYEMLTGKLPFRGDYEQAVIYSIMNEEAEEIDTIPEGMRDIILKCLAKDPNNRYANMKALLRDLKGIVDCEKILAFDNVPFKYKKPAKLWPALVIFINLVLPAFAG
jgi:serine/threonine-protein kinase